MVRDSKAEMEEKGGGVDAKGGSWYKRHFKESKWKVFGNFGWEFLLGWRMKWGKRIKRRKEIKEKKNKKWVVRASLQKLERRGSKRQRRRVARFGSGYFLQEDIGHLKPNNIAWGDLFEYGKCKLCIFFIYLVHSLLIFRNNLLIYM